MPTGIDHRRHHDLEERVEPGNGVLSAAGPRRTARKSRMSTNITAHVPTLPGEHVVTLLEQPRRQSRIDIGPERRLKPLLLSQTRLHAG